MKKIDLPNEKRKFGKHVITLRKRIKSDEYENRFISQQELSDRGENISKKTIGQIERGETNPSFEILLALSVVLDVSLKELFDY